MKKDADPRTLQFSFWCKQYTVHSCKALDADQARSNMSGEMHPIRYPMLIPFAPSPTWQLCTGRAFGWLIACGQLGFMLGVVEPKLKASTWQADPREIEHHQEFIGSLLQMTVDLDQTAVKAVSNVFQTATCGLRGRQTWMWFVLSWAEAEMQHCVGGVSWILQMNFLSKIWPAEVLLAGAISHMQAACSYPSFKQNATNTTCKINGQDPTCDEHLRWSQMYLPQDFPRMKRLSVSQGHRKWAETTLLAIHSHPASLAIPCYSWTWGLPHTCQVIKGWRGTFLLMGLITQLGRQNQMSRCRHFFHLFPCCPRPLTREKSTDSRDANCDIDCTHQLRVGIRRFRRLPFVSRQTWFWLSPCHVVHLFSSQIGCHGISKGWFDWQVGAKLDSLHGEDGSSVRAFGWMTWTERHNQNIPKLVSNLSSYLAGKFPESVVLIVLLSCMSSLTLSTAQQLWFSGTFRSDLLGLRWSPRPQSHTKAWLV